MRRSAQSRTLIRLGETSDLASFSEADHGRARRASANFVLMHKRRGGEPLISPCRRFDIGLQLYEVVVTAPGVRRTPGSDRPERLPHGCRPGPFERGKYVWRE